MKNRLYLLLLAMSALYTSAQEADIPCKIQKSDLFKDNYTDSSIVSADEDSNGGVVIVRSYRGGVFNSGTHGYYFEHYDADMQLLNEYEYPLNDGYVLGMLIHGDKVHIVDFTYVKEDKAYVCSSSSASVSDFKFETKELFRLAREEVKSGSWFGSGSYDNDSFATMLVNTQKTAFAISIDINDKEQSNEMHKLFVYDAALALKIEHVFKRDLKDRDYVYENIDISPDGNTVYLLGKAYTKEAGKKKEGGKYQYELTRITASDSKTQAFDTEARFASSLKTVLKEGSIACVGFYSDRKDGRFKGLCYFDLDPVTLLAKTKKYNPFTTQFLTDKYGRDRDKELKHIAFRDVFLTKNNDIVFNAEEYYVTGSNMAAPNGIMKQSINTCHYDDIVSVKIDAKGDILWARNINKYQSSEGCSNPYISYSAMINGDDTYFFINASDMVPLSNNRMEFVQDSPKRSGLYIIRIDRNGSVESKEVLNGKDNEVPFMVPYGAITRHGNAIYFIGSDGKKKQLLKLTI